MRYLAYRPEGATIQDIQKRLGVSYGRARHILHGKKAGEEGGLVLKVKALRYEPESISVSVDGGETRKTKPRNIYKLDTEIYNPLEKLYGTVVALKENKG